MTDVHVLRWHSGLNEIDRDIAEYRGEFRQNDWRLGVSRRDEISALICPGNGIAIHNTSGCATQIAVNVRLTQASRS
jgi:hypothetical protein